MRRTLSVSWPFEMRDLRLAVRSLTRTKGLSVTAILTLAVGIGASTAMFSVVQAVLLSPMGISAPDRVVVMWPMFSGTPGEFSFNASKNLNERSGAFERVAITGSVNWDARFDLGEAAPKQLHGAAVSANLFETLGATPFLGRTFRADEDVPSASRVIVLSHAMWTTHFGADPGVVGRTVRIRERVETAAFEIIGVMPPEFFYPSGAMYWLAAAPTIARHATQDGQPIPETLENLGVFHALGRLRPGVSLDAARSDTARVWKAARTAGGEDSATMSVALTPLLDHVFGRARPALTILMGAVSIVLLAACSNVAGLLLSRGASRRREFAVRTALGASRGKLVSQLFAEAALLAAAGAALGVAIAAMSINRLVSLSPADIQRLDGLAIDYRVAAFASAITVVTAVLLTILPAWHLRRWSLAEGIQGGTKGTVSSSARGGVRQTLVVLQVTAGMVLLVGTGLTVRSFEQLSALDLGFDPSNVLTFDVDGLDESRYPDKAQRHELVAQLVDRLGRSPQVRSAAAVLLRPFGAGAIGWDSALLLEGQSVKSNDWVKNPTVTFEVVTPNYFRTMSIRIVKGRDFRAEDRSDSPPVVIISENLAERLWPGQDPIGKRLVDTFVGVGDGGALLKWQTVVGVVSAAYYREIDRARFDLYLPLRQALTMDPSHFVVRSTGDPMSLAATVAAEAARIDPGLTINEPTTMDAVVARVRGPWHFIMIVFVAFGVVSTALTAIGLFGLVAYTVTQRRREVGVRVALGAGRGAVVGLFVREATKLVTLGLVAGVVVAALTTRFLASLLFAVSPTDVATFAGAGVVLTAVTLLACYVPARRAASIDPAIVFRDDSA